jgi:hypothetical protein
MLPPAHNIPAFLLKPVNFKQGAELLRGSWRGYAADYQKIDVIEPRIEALDNIKESGHDYFLAIQFQERGWYKLAEAVFERSRGNFHRAPEVHLAWDAWHYWTGDLRNATSDWHKVAKQAKVILDREPGAFEDGHRALLRSIELSLKPGNAKAGSVEKLLEEFIRRDDEFGPGDQEWRIFFFLAGQRSTLSQDRAARVCRRAGAHCPLGR